MGGVGAGAIDSAGAGTGMDAGGARTAAGRGIWERIVPTEHECTDDRRECFLIDDACTDARKYVTVWTVWQNSMLKYLK